MGLETPPLKIKILPESNPLKSIILVRRLAVVPSRNCYPAPDLVFCLPDFPHVLCTEECCFHRHRYQRLFSWVRHRDVRGQVANSDSCSGRPTCWHAMSCQARVGDPWDHRLALCVFPVSVLVPSRGRKPRPPSCQLERLSLRLS